MKKDYNYGYYLVAFIDILGQKEAFKGINSVPAEGEEDLKEKLDEAHEQTVLFLEVFQEAFNDLFNKISKGTESKMKVPNTFKKQFYEMRKVTLKHKRFSDCTLAFVPLQTDKYHSNVVNGVHAVITSCGAMSLLSLSHEKAIRAGIEVGLGTELENGEVYGPALFKAYNLESKIAQYPRIVIGPELMNYLINLSKKNPQMPNQAPPKDIEFCKITADKCLKMIMEDFDGHNIVDYLGDELKKTFTNPSVSYKITYEEIFERASKFVEEEYQKRKKMEDSKLALRYYLLFNYFKNKNKNE